MRRLLLLVSSIAILQGCDGPGRSVPGSADEGRTPPKIQQERPRPAPSPSHAAASRNSRPARDAEDAAGVVRDYYALLGAGRFGQAWALRSPEDDRGFADFAAAYGRYADLHATIGVPSEPQRAGDRLFVEVPVQTYGRMKDGKPFGSAGTITLRRAANGSRWRIHTSG